MYSSHAAKDNTVHTFNVYTSRPDVCQYLVVQTPIDYMSKNNPSNSMTHVTFELKLRSVLRSIGAVVYYARAAHLFSVGIKCQRCSFDRYEYLSKARVMNTTEM